MALLGRSEFVKGMERRLQAAGREAFMGEIEELRCQSFLGKSLLQRCLDSRVVEVEGHSRGRIKT